MQISDLRYLYDELKDACPLKSEIKGSGFDMIIVRELTGGLYFGERHTDVIDGVRTAVDTLKYNENEIRRIAIKAFDIASKRRKRLQVLIRQMYWIPQGCGEVLSKRLQRIILMLNFHICLSTTVQCSL